jgi:TrmH family RNA methyltransferase
VEGARELALALEAGLVPDPLFVADQARKRPPVAADEVAGVAGPPPLDSLLADTERVGGRQVDVPDDLWAKIAVREGGDGLLAICAVPDVSPERLRLPNAPLVLAASGVEKPGNVGALLRSADAFGVDAFVAEGGTDLFNPNVVRASLGCLFTVPVAAVPAGLLLDWLRKQGLRILVATPDGRQTPDQTDFSGPVAVVVGSEDRGLARAALAAADEHVRIPMRGRADSLNVSVSAAVLLYEADRQRAR